MKSTECRKLVLKHTPYLFESHAWHTLLKQDFNIINLDQPFRQDDFEYLKLLDEFRVGKCSRDSFKIIEDCRGKTFDKGILVSSFLRQPTRLFVYRQAAAKENIRQLKRIAAGREIVVHDCIDSVRYETLEYPHMPPPSEAEKDHFDKQGFFNSYVIPRSLERFFDAFATSATSTCVGAQVILLKNLDIRLGLVNGARGTVISYVSKLDSYTRTTVKIPLVDFNGNHFLVKPCLFEAFAEDGVYALRYAIPLSLAYALTIHKSQGMSLDYVEIDAPKTFSPGQCYVAFSRVRGIHGLSVRAFERDGLWASEKVAKFYKKVGVFWFICI